MLQEDYLTQVLAVLWVDSCLVILLIQPWLCIWESIDINIKNA